jgi:hypothetical protein
MSGVFQNIDPPPPHRPASVYHPPLVRGEHTLAGWRGGGGSIFWKTPDTALYTTYVSTLCLPPIFLLHVHEGTDCTVGAGTIAGTIHSTASLW